MVGVIVEAPDTDQVSCIVGLAGEPQRPPLIINGDIEAVTSQLLNGQQDYRRLVGAISAILTESEWSSDATAAIWDTMIESIPGRWGYCDKCGTAIDKWWMFTHQTEDEKWLCKECAEE